MASHATGAVAEVVVPLDLAKAGFLSGSTVVLGIGASAKERPEDAKFHAYDLYLDSLTAEGFNTCTKGK